MTSAWGQGGDDGRSGGAGGGGRRGFGRWGRDDQHGPDGDQAWLGGSSGSGSSGGRGSGDRSRNETSGPVFSSDFGDGGGRGGSGFDDGRGAGDGPRGVRGRRARDARDDLGGGPTREPGEPEFFATMSKGAKSLLRLVVIGVVGFIVIRVSGRRHFEGWNADAVLGLPVWAFAILLIILVWLFRGMRRK